MVSRRRKSRQRSGGNPRRRSERLVFFTEASLGRNVVPDALRAAGEEVAVHDDLFSPGLHDHIRLETAAAKKRVVLMADPEFRHHYNEIAQLAAARVRVFVLTDKSLSGVQMAKAFVKALPRIKELCSKKADGSVVAEVRRNGKVEVMRSRK